MGRRKHDAAKRSNATTSPAPRPGKSPTHGSSKAGRPAAAAPGEPEWVVARAVPPLKKHRGWLLVCTVAVAAWIAFLLLMAWKF